MMRASVLVALTAFCTVACGAAAPEAQSAATSIAPEPEPTTIEEAEQQFRRARQALEPAPAPAADAPLTTEASRPHSTQEPEACRALHSLERATKALCRLAGQDDARCKEAVQVLEQSRSRVTCP